MADRVAVVRRTERIVVQTVPRQLTVAAPGPQGRRGLPGADGQDGGAYAHTQTLPVSLWTVQHGLGYRPGGIAVIDSDGADVDPVATHLSDDVVLLTFYGPTSGTAYLS